MSGRIGTGGKIMRRARVLALGLLVVLGLVPQARAGDEDGLLFRFSEQEATFESFQVNRRFFVCVVESANANLDPQTERQTLEAADACIKSVVEKDATLDQDGFMVRGVDAIADVVTGVLSDVRQNVGFTIENPLVLDFVPGRRPGTGEITVGFGIEVTQDLVAPGPFGNVLGGQVGRFRNRMILRAVRPHEWRIRDFVVRQLSAESGLDIRFPSPFPRFPIEYPRQRGDRARRSR
jgi:hypothetical protein